jgi:isopentenyl diphosphate isomerase/L-lactate dehydrogenase-like FMN-dependent dehydrogenase
MGALERVYNIADLREIAKRRLPKGLFEFIDRGNDDELAVQENRAALDRIRLKPRVLVDVSKRSQEITLLGRKQAMPIVVGPTGSAGLTWYEGEVELARAAAKAGIPFTLATAALSPLETIAAQGGTPWFQLYMWEDRKLSHELVIRARDAGFEALVFTVDTPVNPGREYNLRNGFSFPFRFTSRNVFDVLCHPRWIAGVLARYVLTTGMPRFANFPQSMQTSITSGRPGRAFAANATVNAEDIRELRKLWPRKLIVKGIQRHDDALLALSLGADAVVVSNHGGRVLDTSRAPIDSLREIVDAVNGRMTVIVDSGIRRGTDIAKALALGADAVMIGRATLYGTASGGEAGASRAIQIFREELDRTLALLGCRSVAELSREHLVLPRE